MSFARDNFKTLSSNYIEILFIQLKVENNYVNKMYIYGGDLDQ